MRKDEHASISIIKIIGISILLILFLGIGVMAANAKIKNVRIVFSNNYEINILTTKTKVEEILRDNHIVLAEKEYTIPNLEEDIIQGKPIYIKIEQIELDNNDDDVNSESINIENIIDNYSAITEKIVTLEIEIPYETITKDISGANEGETISKIIQEGKNGLKIIVYKIMYKNNIEIDRIELENKIIEEPIDKIIQINRKQISRGNLDRMVSANLAVNSTVSLAKKVENIEPKVVTLNASAYTASTCGKTVTDSGYGYTASGAKAREWYTVAAGKGYAMGTVMYIPYFKNMPNEGWFVVQDRGSAITNNKVDIYMSTYNECMQFGRRNLECYIYEF